MMINPLEPEIKPEVSTHEALRQRLLELNSKTTVEVEDLTPFEHDKAGIVVYVGPMSYDDHKKWKDIKRFEEISHIEAKKTEDDPQETKRSDQFLLGHAVYSVEGTIIGDELAKILINLQGAGPDNYTLLSQAEICNPPRQLLATEVVQMMNAKSVDCVLWRLLIEGGLVKVLIDYMSTHSTPEEFEWAQHELAKAEQVAMAFWPLFQAEEAAKLMGITFRGAVNMLKESPGADAQDLINAKNAVEQARSDEMDP